MRGSSARLRRLRTLRRERGALLTRSGDYLGPMSAPGSHECHAGRRVSIESPAALKPVLGDPGEVVKHAAVELRGQIVNAWPAGNCQQRLLGAPRDEVVPVFARAVPRCLPRKHFESAVTLRYQSRPTVRAARHPPEFPAQDGLSLPGKEP